jgi:hypothetical protein
MQKLEEEDEFILVRCSAFNDFFLWNPSILVYRNAHAIIHEKQNVTDKFSRRSQKESVNVFLMGIDSVSRLNMIRAMPETYMHLQNNEWFELRGYNKIADNTFPNLMAILTGKNLSEIDATCNWRKVGELEKCVFAWNDYKNAGYATAFAEDEAKINTFNYYETGFVHPPTDHYLRPFSLAIEKDLHIIYKHDLKFCVGYQHYADHVYNYGFDFAQKYINNSFFGLFWTNSFSHEDLSMVSAMDTKVKFYLEQLEVRGILNSSIVIFFSDHGMRFGPIRNHFTGWLEERLPFFFIWLPQHFRDQHPDIVNALRVNQDRLSSPYDFHVTLKHILKLSGGFDEEPSAISCPTCQSLFTELPFNRSCADAGIDRHWCTCVNFDVVDKTSKIVQSAVEKIVQEVNNDLKPHSECAQLRLQRIHSARKSNSDYLISFNVSPSDAELEATIRCFDEMCIEYSILGTVSRLNRYGDQSRCVKKSYLRKVCFCLK